MALQTAQTLNDEIKPLVHRLTAATGAQKPSIYTLIAARPFEGTTTVTQALAVALYAQTQKKILVIEAGRPRTATAPRPGLAETVLAKADVETALAHKDPGVFTTFWASSEQGRVAAGALLQDQGFWRGLQATFEYILIDAPSLQASPDGIAFARISDQTVIVVEAETTRKQVIENLRDNLAAAGAKIAGVVLNKRRYYIPEKIYKHL
jgi:protein-tyrosine kinase